MANSPEEFIWAQKYRPKKLDDCILPESVKTQFRDFIKQGEIPHFLFYGNHGIGKTTVAYALCDELGSDYMYINGSEESGIDVLRGKIKSYASSISLNGNKKVIILDEADFLNAQSTQPALRGLMEEFSSNCRFILTCNYKNKIIPAIQSSRCTQVEFKIPKEDKQSLAKQIYMRCTQILEKEGIEYDKKVLVELITKCFPDFRKLLNELQRYSASGRIDSGILVNISDETYKELFKSLKDKNFKEVRSWVGKNSDVDSSVLFRKLYDKSDELLSPESVPQLIIILGEYQHKAAIVVDHEINNIACLTQVMGECKFLG